MKMQHITVKAYSKESISYTKIQINNSFDDSYIFNNDVKSVIKELVDELYNYVRKYNSYGGFNKKAEDAFEIVSEEISSFHKRIFVKVFCVKTELMVVVDFEDV